MDGLTEARLITVEKFDRHATQIHARGGTVRLLYCVALDAIEVALLEGQRHRGEAGLRCEVPYGHPAYEALNDAMSAARRDDGAAVWRALANLPAPAPSLKVVGGRG